MGNPNLDGTQRKSVNLGSSKINFASIEATGNYLRRRIEK